MRGYDVRYGPVPESAGPARKFRIRVLRRRTQEPVHNCSVVTRATREHAEAIARYVGYAVGYRCGRAVVEEGD